MKSTRLVLLVGGRSTEHDASLHSYHALLADLNARRDSLLRTVAVCYADRAGLFRWHGTPEFPRTEAQLASGCPLGVGEVIGRLRVEGAFIFSLLHGNEGEDGAWQGLAEIADLRGSFGSVFSSALTMNKWAQSIIAGALEPELRIPKTVLMRARTAAADLETGLPCLGDAAVVIKPNRMGASHFASPLPCASVSEILACAERIFPYDEEVLVQERIDGVEYTVGCIEEKSGVRALPVIEARTERGFLGHVEKHATRMVEPFVHHVDSGPTGLLKKLSVALFRHFGVSTMCRFDFIVDARKNLFFLEANSIPGLSVGSAYPTMLRAVGKTRVDVVHAALRCHNKEQRRQKVLRYAIQHDHE
jgi:D-alanine-D-alanine ligase